MCVKARNEQAFRQNAIEADVLPELTDEHLRELGRRSVIG